MRTRHNSGASSSSTISSYVASSTGASSAPEPGCPIPVDVIAPVSTTRLRAAFIGGETVEATKSGYAMDPRGEDYQPRWRKIQWGKGGR